MKKAKEPKISRKELKKIEAEALQKAEERLVDLEAVSAETKNQHVVNEAHNIVNNVIVSKIPGAEKFDLSKMQLSSVEEGEFINVWGNVSVREIYGLDPMYVFVTMDVSENWAKIITEKIKELDDSLTPEDLYVVNDDDNEKRGLAREEIKQKYIDVYAAFSAAIERSYGAIYKKVFNFGQIKLAIDTLYQNALPEAKEKVDADVISKCVIKLVDVTFVNDDRAQNTSYFYVDTLQTFNTNGVVEIAKCRARIDVHETGVSEQETFARFVGGKLGEDYGFKEVYRIVLGKVAVPELRDQDFIEQEI